MSLNIKDERADRLIRELATLRGKSLVAAVTEAVEEKLEKERERQRKKRGMAEWLMEISRETGPMMDDGKSSIALIEELYDPETGLPR